MASISRREVPPRAGSHRPRRYAVHGAAVSVCDSPIYGIEHGERRLRVPRALAERAALVGAAVVERAVAPLVTGEGDAAMARGDRGHAALGEPLGAEHPMPHGVLGSAHGALT